MRRERRCFSALSVMLVLAVPAAAQEYSDPLARKLLDDYLPTYTPFIPPAPPDRYFPDAVGKTVADAIVDAYLEDPAAVGRRARELSRHDAELAARGEVATGVTPYVLALAASPASTQGKEDQGLAGLANASPDTILAQAEELVADEKRNRWARTFNWVLSSLDVASLFLGTPRTPSPYGAQSIISEWTSGNEPAPRERKALVLYREFLRRAPEDPRAAEVEKKTEEIAARRRQAMLEAELSQAETAFKQRDYWRANFHYQLALMVDETSGQAQAGVRQVEAALQQKDNVDEAPPQDPFAGIKKAEWEHDKETLQYLLPGSGFIKDNFVVAGTQVALEGLVGAATFGGLTLLQTGAKVFRLLTSNPVSKQKVITEGEKYLHETPQTDRNPEVYGILAAAYEREGQFDKAIDYYQLAGRAEKVPQLREQAGKALLQMATQSPHQAQQESYLRTLIERYPGTKAAREAAPQLRALNLPINRGLRLSKAFLKENADLVGPYGLGLKRELFDGDADNVELTDDGITLLPNGTVALSLQSDQGPRNKVYGVPEASWERFWRGFREKGYERAARDGDQGLAMLAQGAEDADITLKGEREQNEQEGWRALPYLSGSLSGSSLDVRGTLPKEMVGTRITFGNDQRSSYIGVEVPMPLIPVDFLFLGRNGAPSLYPRIRSSEKELKDENLYR